MPLTMELDSNLESSLCAQCTSRAPLQTAACTHTVLGRLRSCVRATLNPKP